MADNVPPILDHSGIADPGESLSPDIKKARTAESFGRKVALLETWTKSGVPAEQWWPKTPTELRQWHQPDIHDGVRAWSSPNVASGSGVYADLRGRFDIAVKRLAARREVTPRSELLEERAARVRAEARVSALTAQNASLLDRVRRTEDDLAVVKAARDADTKRVADYEASFGKVAPMMPRKGR